MIASSLSRPPAWLAWLAGLAVIIGFLNFLWFFAESATIGDANRGYVRDGRYFLVNAGVATEVSEAAWEWSEFHGRSVLITHPLAVLGGAYLMFTVVFPSAVGRRDPDADARVARIRASGPPLLEGRTGGRLGDLRLTRPLIAVAVHPDGIVLTPFGLAPIGIDRTALIGTVVERSALTGWGLRIAHRQAGVPERVSLLVASDSALEAAIRDLMSDSGSPVDGDPTGTAQARDTTRIEPFSTSMKVVTVAGLVLSLVFMAVVFSTGFATRLGAFGILWAVGLVAIAGFNVWHFFIRDRRRW